MSETAKSARFLNLCARHAYLLLALLCLALWTPGILSLPALDRDESRFAQSSRQMLDSGNFVDIRFGQVPRYKKPVGIYWLQAAATGAVSAVTGDDTHIWTYRLPSLIGAIVAVWLTIWCGSVFGIEAGFLAGLLMAVSILLTGEATIATTDAVLLAAVTGMQGVLLRVWRAARDADAPAVSTRTVMMGWIAVAIGILVKFPVVPGVGLVTVIGLIAWDRQWRWLGGLKPVPGLLLTALLVLPWVAAIALQSHGAFFQQSLGNDFAAKIAGGQEGHGQPPGYFLALSALSLWPAILFVAAGLGLGWARRSDPAIRFLLVWAAGWWLLCEAVPTKLPHYILPAYPALAILAALWVLNPDDALPARPWLKSVGAVQFLTGLTALAIVTVLLPARYGVGDAWWDYALAGAGLVMGLAALILFLLGRPGWAMTASVLAALILTPGLTAVVGPGLDQLWVSRKLAALVVRDGRAGDPAPVLAGFEEPSLVFALGADVGLTDGRGAAEMGSNAGGLALVDDDERPAFLARLAELQGDATQVDDLSGFNYSRGHTVHVTVYRITPASAPPQPSP